MAATLIMLSPLPANADAGNPILGTIRGTMHRNTDGTATVFVRGQWNWISHTSDCNFDRAAAGLGLIWNDPTEPGFTVTKGSITAGVGIATSAPRDNPASPSFNAAHHNDLLFPSSPTPTSNGTDQMAHPSDRGNVVEGYTATGDFPTGQAFVDSSPPNPNSYLSWKGGCGREPITATPSKNAPGGGPNGEATGLPCAEGNTKCSGHPWGSWGYEKNGALGYSHTYAKASDITKVCVNFYDVHGGGTGTKFQLVNGAKEITVNGNGDNSIQTNAFNPQVGANCVSFPFIDHTTAKTNVTVGDNINDTATIVGAASNQTTYVQFHLFAPGDPTCAGTDLYSGGRKSITGDGDVVSDDVATTQAGDYHWTAELFDAAKDGNLLDSTKCGDPGETSHVNKAPPTLTTNATASVTVGDPISDTATLSGGFSPTGSITFKLFPPTDPTCSGTAAFTAPVTVAGNGSYPSGSFTSTAAGTWHWVASYSGDANNIPVSTTCGDSGESSVVEKAKPGGSTAQNLLPNDTAHLSDGANPTGTINFGLFGPDDATCSGTAAFSQTVNVAGNGDYTTTNSSTLITESGTWSWLLGYSGDSANLPSSVDCGVEAFVIVNG